MTERQLAEKLRDDYKFAEKTLGDKFESTMAEIAAEITLLQYKCKEGTTFDEAGMLMSLTSEEDWVKMSDEERELTVKSNRLIRACVVWWLMQ